MDCLKINANWFGEIEMYLDDCQLMFPTILKPTEEELAKFTRQDCGSDMFDHELIWQNTGQMGDDYSGILMFPIEDGYYISVEYYQK